MQFEHILQLVVSKNASDLHLKVGSRPIIRKNRQLYLLDKTLPQLTEENIRNLINPLLSPELKELYKKNKNIDFGYYFKNIGRFRFSVFSQKATTRVVARIIPDKIKTFQELNLPSSLETLSQYKNGLILITGATGSGKSSTAAALINLLNHTYSYHIITIEDPIEYVIQDQKSCITQREYLLDFTNHKDAFKGGLRQDPDVIFFGELRDAETVAIALQAADSGHLVISTLHTSTALETFGRLLSYFNDSAEQESIRRRLINSLQVIIGQQLVPSLAGNLTPIIEIFFNNLTMKQALMENKSFSEIHTLLEEGKKTWGMQSFDQNIVDLVQKGIISESIGLQYATKPNNVKLILQGVKSTNTSFMQNKPDQKNNHLDQYKTLQLETENSYIDPKTLTIKKAK
ncbi:MAG: PilT/PilU family type 4a pilus ATPase [Bdellovibrionales bacterium]|nr:PilT/PilU family type 4a pilus ATPase [Bdellovibrionales bacterium]